MQLVERPLGKQDANPTFSVLIPWNSAHVQKAHFSAIASVGGLKLSSDGKCIW